MVKVWYQPPPYGPRTALNRPSYATGVELGPRWVQQLSKAPPARVICGFIAGATALAYIPLSEFGGVSLQSLYRAYVQSTYTVHFFNLALIVF